MRIKPRGDVHGIDRSNIPALRQALDLVLMPWW